MRNILAILLVAGGLMLVPRVAQTQPIPVPVTASVGLAWDANVEPDIAGYRIYFRQTTSTGVWAMSDVGNVTTTVVGTLARGVEYSFFATAYNTSGLESEPSNTVRYVPPKPPAAPRTLRSTGAGGGP